MKQFWNNTKVVCTIGPACDDRKTLKSMMLAGMDVARFNFSHGKPQEHVAQIRMLKSIAEKQNLPLAVLQDLPGPKIRIGELKEDFIDLEKEQLFFLTSQKIIGNREGVSVNHSQFIKGLKKNSVVFLNDGLVKLVVISKTTKRAICSVISGGRIYPRKGVSCPNQFLNMRTVTPYDLKCLRYGIKAGVDFVAVSFVQRAADILQIKKYLKKRAEHIFVIAKIERKIAFEDIDNIIKASDAIMVARGDLGLEAELSEVPFLQKELIKKCNLMGKPVITATQMLESMVVNTQPTRAEVTDVANAILDGTDATMLSEETAVGKFPLKTLKMMVKIASHSEKKINIFSAGLNYSDETEECIVESFSNAAVSISGKTRTRAIIVPTNNIQSISWVSRRRPDCPIIAITSKDAVYKKLILFWGVYPIKIKKFSGLQDTLKTSVRLAKAQGIVKKNDRVVVMLTKDNRLFNANIMQEVKIN